jgi:hypothetical protein
MNETKLIEEKYEGNVIHRNEILSPSSTIIVDAIGRLNGRDRSSMMIIAGDRMLFMGGGLNNCYVCEIAVDTDREFLRLVHPDRADSEKIKLIVGGQSVFRNIRQCCTRDEVNSAANNFTFGTSLVDSVVWERK